VASGVNVFGFNQAENKSDEIRNFRINPIEGFTGIEGIRVSGDPNPFRKKPNSFFYCSTVTPLSGLKGKEKIEENTDAE
jgi:hypothetical protein